MERNIQPLEVGQIMHQYFCFSGLASSITNVFIGGSKNFPQTFLRVIKIGSIDFQKGFVDGFLRVFDVGLKVVGFKQELSKKFLIVFLEPGQLQAMFNKFCWRQFFELFLYFGYGSGFHAVNVERKLLAFSY